jgi:hypothetical protein
MRKKLNKTIAKPFTVTQADLDKIYRIYDQFFKVISMSQGELYRTAMPECLETKQEKLQGFKIAYETYAELENVYRCSFYTMRDEPYIPKIKITMKQLQELIQSQ